MDRFYSLNHSSIDFLFKQTPRDFVVEELPLYEFSGEGEHLVLFVRKKSLSTLELVSLIAKYLGIKNKEIGYAGLKDKHAMTKQYISIHKQYEEAMENFSHDNVKIISKTYHNNKIKTGHLRGNRFYIKLKKVNPTSAQKIDEALKNISKDGMPNFFGYQRFGNDGDNHIEGEKVAKGEKKERNPKIKKLLINAYQSHLFNLWLSRRLEINTLVQNFKPQELESLLNMPNSELVSMKAQKHPFKLISGDIMEHYPHGRLFDFDGKEDDCKRFNDRDISPTGLLCGKKVKQSSGSARLIEKDFDDEINADGARRYAWVFPEEVEGRFKPIEAQYELNFSLPKGSYATVLIEELAKRKINDKKDIR
ncbi:tRNA pseudouridine(13) synthase TruD [Sulfurimonas sp.]|uniref:tRNA pseudouridine(13) synthase TruD n=1 Tax=Sulfurimonas sp. TaxID=2022749 RepID=UPI00260DC6DB|nr:tRNA pseudouridine(13) synthase TruD [Sulfurimonas sp.]MCW8895086.1 tRNA pseudouridine(13) synthase TruD [Sulfurimonas sp.]MCW9066960.1 tRNA pseudouridine(13) synthase TruD [Sulfurimonas sp.]